MSTSGLYLNYQKGQKLSDLFVVRRNGNYHFNPAFNCGEFAVIKT